MRRFRILFFITTAILLVGCFEEEKPFIAEGNVTASETLMGDWQSVTDPELTLEISTSEGQKPFQLEFGFNDEGSAMYGKGFIVSLDGDLIAAARLEKVEGNSFREFSENVEKWGYWLIDFRDEDTGERLKLSFIEEVEHEAGKWSIEPPDYHVEFARNTALHQKKPKESPKYYTVTGSAYGQKSAPTNNQNAAVPSEPDLTIDPGFSYVLIAGDGIMVTGVANNSKAIGWLNVGDVIRSINGIDTRELDTRYEIDQLLQYGPLQVSGVYYSSFLEQYYTFDYTFPLSEGGSVDYSHQEIEWVRGISNEEIEGLGDAELQRYSPAQLSFFARSLERGIVGPVVGVMRPDNSVLPGERQNTRIEQLRQAVKIYQKAADRGSILSQRRLALIRLVQDVKTGGDPSAEMMRGFNEVMRLSESGDIASTHILGAIYANGLKAGSQLLIPANPKESYRILTALYENGYLSTAFLLGGVMIENGSMKEAADGLKILRTGRSVGSSGCASYLGYLTFEGHQFIQKDHRKGIELLKEGARGGNPMAIENIQKALRIVSSGGETKYNHRDKRRTDAIIQQMQNMKVPGYR